MNVWRVVYDSRFSSSSGMKEYRIDHNDIQALVLTVGGSLEDVENSIKSSLNNQTRFVRLTRAEWLGKAIGRWHMLPL
jgi:hypothetical protein